MTAVAAEASAMIIMPLHGIASRHDLPLPFSFVLVGAGAALLISFVVLLTAWRTPRFCTVGGIAVPGVQRVVDHPATGWIGRIAALVLLALTLLSLAGQDRLTNPIFGIVFVWVWVGLVPLSLIAGRIWRATNPVRTLHAGLTRLARLDPDRGLFALPRRLGVWPAAGLLFAYAWLELVQPDRASLTVIRIWVLAWLIIMIIGAVVFGRRWIGAADPFETYAATVAQLSPWRRVDGQLRLVNPLRGLAHWGAPPGAVGVVAVLLGSTAFDSFANLTWWIATVQSSTVSPVVWETGGLLIMIMIVGVTFGLAAAWMARYARPGAPTSPGHYPRLMAGSVVPIVIGYAVAHYATLLIVEGQRVAINLSDPLGLGWNLFGTAGLQVDDEIFRHPTAVALTQLIAIVSGHVLGIISAHERSVSLLRPDAALRGQWPMLLVMIFYTCSGLVLLFSP